MKNYVGNSLSDYIGLDGSHCISKAFGEVLINTCDYFKNSNFDESMYFGIDCGIDFVYRKLESNYPPVFLGGRYCNWISDFCDIYGIGYTRNIPSNDEVAWLEVKRKLDEGIPVLIEIDKFHIEYWRNVVGFSDVGGHLIVLIGYDEENVYISDECPFNPGLSKKITFDELKAARNSKLYWKSPENSWYSFDYPNSWPNIEEVAVKAIYKNSKRFIESSQNNGIYTGLQALRVFADEIVKWDQYLDYKIKSTRSDDYIPALSYQLFLTSKLLHSGGAGGGGNFRILYSKFLKNVAKIFNKDEFNKYAESLLESALNWEKISKLIDENEKKYSHIFLEEIQGIILKCIDIEESIFKQMFSFSSNIKSK